jgi:hypothetical protein
LIDLPANPAKVRRQIELANDLRRSLEDRSSFRPDDVDPSLFDGGAPLVGDDRDIFDRAIRYCQWRFGHLPMEYILET